MSKLALNPSTKAAVIGTAAVVATSCVSFLEILPHTFCIEKYRKFLAKYKRDVEVPLHKDVEKLFNEVLDDLKVKPIIRDTYKPFTIAGFEIYHAGFTESSYGVIIGIPGHFVYKDKRFVDILDIRVGYDRTPLNPYEASTDELIESMVLSDKAKKFGIAREILMSQKYLPLYRSIESPIMISLTAIMADMLRTRYEVFKRSFALGVSSYLGLGLLSFSTWFQFRDGLNTYFEKSVDQELAKLGPDYVEGGKEFYEKILIRNRAMRKILGVQGKKKFNTHGDEIFFIRHKRTPITYRKKFFENYKQIEAVPEGQPLAA